MLIALGVSGLVAILVGAAVIVTVNTIPARQASATVVAYFDALAGRHPVTISDLVAPEVMREVEAIGEGESKHPAVVMQLTTRTGYSAPSHVEVESVTRDGDRATVAVTYRVTGVDQPQRASLELSREEGSWLILNPFGTLALAGILTTAYEDGAVPPHRTPLPLSRCAVPPNCEITLSGVAIGRNGWAVREATLLPGRHEFRFQRDDEAGSVETWSFIVPPGGSGSQL